MCLQKAFETEREELLENNRRKWDSSMGGRRDQELDYMHQRDKRVDEHEAQIQHLRIQDAEEYNMVKIKLETDVQVGLGPGAFFYKKERKEAKLPPKQQQQQQKKTKKTNKQTNKRTIRQPKQNLRHNCQLSLFNRNIQILTPPKKKKREKRFFFFFFTCIPLFFEKICL